MTGKLTALPLTATCLLLSACGSLSHLDGPGRPADFALTLTVQMYDRNEPNEQYVLEPNRQLRAALGRDVYERTFPPVTAVLTPQQMDQIWQLTDKLLATPPQRVTSTDQHMILYTVTAHGQRRSEWTPLDNPAITDLLTTLRHLRGG
ncbi:MAG: hypothetical protein IT445_05670 [Phycisphaeraceae bacterium]|nr:hypothetical protein [Phycisphaeraceae bacterium]